MQKTIQVNQQRIEYLIRLYGLSIEAFLARISKGLKHSLTKQQIFENPVQISHLKRVDSIFKKGLSYYTDPSDIKENNSSIFFRKTHFNSPLEFGDRKRISAIEDTISSLQGLARLSKAESLLKPKLKECSTQDDPQEVADKVRTRLQLSISKQDDRAFLKDFIEKLADYHIFVHEFVEAWNMKDKTNLDGFFISPNHIAIKRNQSSLKREIFTLAHELGHYLLDEEEIDQTNFGKKDVSDIEKWCDTFAFALLIGESQSQLKNIPADAVSLENSVIQQISTQQHLSRLAVFTFLVNSEKITWSHYKALKKDLEQEYKNNKQQQSLEKQKNKELGIEQRGAAPKPIVSPLVRNIYISAYFEGVVNEYQILEKCTSNKKKTIEEVIYGA